MFCSTKKFKPKNVGLKRFNLKKINKIKNVHPFFFTMDHIYWCCEDYGEYFIENVDPEEEEEFFCVKDYFKMMDNFYRYGIGFPKKMLHKNKLIVHYSGKNICFFQDIYNYRSNRHIIPMCCYIGEKRFFLLQVSKNYLS